MSTDISRRPVLPVADLDAARRFYVHALGCRPASERAGSGFVELELAGHPLALRELSGAPAANDPSAVFVLGVDDWCALSERLREHDVPTEIEPARRFSVVPGEQCLMRVEDPDGNAIELRGFAREADQLAA